MIDYIIKWAVARITKIGVIPWLIATLVAVLAVVAPDIVQLLHDETHDRAGEVPHVVPALKP